MSTHSPFAQPDSPTPQWLLELRSASESLQTPVHLRAMARIAAQEANLLRHAAAVEHRRRQLLTTQLAGLVDTWLHLTPTAVGDVNVKLAAELDQLAAAWRQAVGA